MNVIPDIYHPVWMTVWSSTRIPGIALIQLILLMMGTWLLETCRQSIWSSTHIPGIALIQLILLMMGTWLPETCRQ